MPLPMYDDSGLPASMPVRDITPNDYVADHWPTYSSNGLPIANDSNQIPIKADATVDQPQQAQAYKPDVAQGVIDSLLGTNGKERYQLWPERVAMDALSVPGKVMTPNPYKEGTEEYLQFEHDRDVGTTKAALDMSALAGTGGLAGAEKGALGSGPFLRPALKYEGKIYKAPIKDASNPLFMGAEHSDAIPQSLLPEFTRQAMNGEDISNFNFGFINHKGQFLDREAALDYGIKEGLLSPHDAKFGALTSTMMADSKPATAIGALEKSQSPFYSALEKNVADIGQNKMTGNQWLGTLANKAGVKPEEMDWTGLKDYLASKGEQSVSKDEVQAHLNDNAVKIGEVNKSLPDETYPVAGGAGTKYSSYQLPGGENYQEKLLTLPEKQGQAYQSSHWDEPNVLAHVRTNDRDVGGIPSKHIEEIQSDWHQQGRDKGYVGEASDLLAKQKAGIIKPEEQNRLDAIISNGTTGGVPNAPFKKSWPELAMKRTIRQAVEEGKSRVSWTPGEAQATRYDLSKSVDKLQYNPDTQILLAHKGNSLVIDKTVAPDKLPDFVGKEAADKILNKPTSKFESPNNKGTFNHYLEGQDLKIGGEGMKGFYDQMLPAMVKNIGKEYGVKLKQEKIIAPMKKMGDSGEQPVHYFDIPEKMKQDVLTKGFPLFSDSSKVGAAVKALDNYNPIQQTPWQKDPKIGWWKDQGDTYTMYHGTHKDNINSMANEGIKAPDSGPTAGKVSMTFDPYTARGYASMGGESGFRAAGAKAKTVPMEDRRVIKAEIPKAWAEENMADMRGNVGSTKDNLTNKDKYDAAKKAGMTDKEYYATTELRFKKPIPKEFIKSVLTNGK